MAIVEFLTLDKVTVIINVQSLYLIKTGHIPNIRYSAIVIMGDGLLYEISEAVWKHILYNMKS